MYNWDEPGQMETVYLVGLFDGEGHIGFSNRERTCPTPAIHLTNSNMVVLKAFRQVFGGVLKGFKRSAPQAVAGGVKKVQAALSSLYPYLVVKQVQAGLMLQFCELPRFNGARIRWGLEPEYSDALVRRCALVSQILAFNAGGPPRKDPKWFRQMVEAVKRNDAICKLRIEGRVPELMALVQPNQYGRCGSGSE